MINYFEVQQIDLRRINAEDRTVEASLSSDAAIDTGYGKQKLVHSEKAVDMTRAADGLPLLFNHNQDRPLGRIRNVQIKGGKLRGTLAFSDNDDADRIFRDVQKGFLTDLSIGFRVDPRSVDLDTEPGTAIVNRWTPHEASIVTVPADHSVGVNRSLFEGNQMETKPKDPNVVAIETARREGAELERARTQEIRRLCKLGSFENDELQARLIGDGVAIDQATTLILEEIGKRNAGYQIQGGFVQTGEDSAEKTVRAMETAVLHRTRYPRLDDSERASLGDNDYRNMSMLELMRECITAGGGKARGLSKEQLFARALETRSTIGVGISDFSNILSNTASKFLLMGFDGEANTTWRRITRTIGLPDFKQADLDALGAFSDLELLPPGGEYKYGTIADRKEVMQLLSYAKAFNLSRQAIINDDLNAFSSIPRKMGQAADRRINALVYAQLTSNPTMNQDATALFDATHANIGTSATIAVASVDEARVLMRKQTDSADANSDGMNVDIAMLIVPSELESTANVLRTASVDPLGLTSATGGAQAPNPEQNRWDVVSDVLLSQSSAAIWYASANPQVHDTLMVGFLDGNSEPFLDSEEVFTRDGMAWKVRIDAAAIPGDFRGLVRNAGV